MFFWTFIIGYLFNWKKNFERLKKLKEKYPRKKRNKKFKKERNDKQFYEKFNGLINWNTKWKFK